MEEILNNKEHVESIFVLNGNDAPVTGLVQANFGITASLNGSNISLSVTITEVDATENPGEYSAKFTPTQVGVLVVRVRHATYEPMGWEGIYEVVARKIAEVSSEELEPRVTEIVGRPTYVSVAVVGYKAQTYRARLYSEGGALEDEDTHLGRGPLVLTPVSSGLKSVRVVGVDGSGNTVTTEVIRSARVPSAS